jgi:F-type H+-transporting ATPase subunit a
MKMSYLSEFLTALKDKLLETIRIGNIGVELNKAILPHPLFDIHIGGLTLIMTDAIVASWIAMLVIAVLAWILGRKPQRIPTSLRQVIAESLVRLLLDLCQASNMTYDQAEKVVPYIGTIAFFISLSNLLTLFNIPPPAKNPAYPIALALVTVAYVIGMSIHLAGIKGFLHSLVYPRAMLLPFRLLDYLIKPITLSLRLFGNIFGAFVLMEFIYLIVPAILPGVIGIWFDLADGILQGIIFTYLTATYIGETLENAHGGEQPLPAAQPAPRL